MEGVLKLKRGSFSSGWSSTRGSIVIAQTALYKNDLAVLL